MAGTKAKVGLDYVAQVGGPAGWRKLVLVTGISPTPAGEGKTTTTIGLGDALNAVSRHAGSMICLREPSLGPCFGMKGGWPLGRPLAQVAPMDEINLHFTGDFHAITSGQQPAVGVVRQSPSTGATRWASIPQPGSSWRRCAGYERPGAAAGLVTSLGGPRQWQPRARTGSISRWRAEVMAVLCLLPRDLPDLQARLGPHPDRRPPAAAARR